MSKNDKELKECVREFFRHLDAVETSDGGREFNPTTISSCRCLVVERLKVLLPRMKELAAEQQS